ncbi:hypothetical protein SBA5_970031 [Candidatus Sulfotelmatomonas gaucii]|uniref:Uncharacterized protein n=1 Tax=Candidatus Sulfuritelmatomonas gaucii TaxID=2043161 RepID=A0A2N9MA14_9BACT|nr:hypothetical protein SBA5_970031 [Candidatus Sulfotelmatomonas gaucii]
MRIFEIKVVVRPIDIPRNSYDRRKLVLLPICHGLHVQHPLRQRIGIARFLGKTIPEGLFLQRKRRLLWISAACSGAHKFLGAALPGIMHGEHAHHQVLIKELSWPLLVRIDSADQASKVDDDVGRMFPEQATNLFFLCQVKVFAGEYKNIMASARLQFLNHVAAEETTATGHQNSLIRPIDLQFFSSPK